MRSIRILLAAVAVAAMPAAAMAFPISAGDRLAISVLGQPDLSGSYAVRPDGSIAMHHVGRVAVAEMDIDAAAALIARRLSETFGAESSVVVDVEAHRPIYVLGDVANPGEFAYRPGLTAIKAAALAGGYQRAAVAGEGNEARAVEARGRALRATARIRTAQAQLEAVEAELAAMDEADLEDLTGQPIEGEQGALIALRREQAARLVANSERQRDLASYEADSYVEQSRIVERQLADSRNQLAAIEGLSERGLARTDSLLNLRLNVGRIESQALEITALRSRAQQNAANAESMSEIERVRYRQALLADKLRLQETIATEEAEHQAAVELARAYGGAAALGVVGVDVLETFEVQRDGAGRFEAIEQGGAIAPGDVLRITLAPAPVEGL
jgi:polysaccharide export outer membrane protein